jgi:hypothetical protein
MLGKCAASSCKIDMSPKEWSLSFRNVFLCTHRSSRRVCASREYTSRDSMGRGICGAAVASTGTGTGAAVTGEHGGESKPVGGDTDSGSFNDTMNCRFERRILRLGRQSGPKLGMPTGIQLSSSIVGWFFRKRALESSMPVNTPVCIANLSFLSFGK